MDFFKDEAVIFQRFDQGGVMANVGNIKKLFGGTEAGVDFTQREEYFDDHAIRPSMRSPIS